MHKHIVISGFGVIGIEVLDQLIKKNKKNKLKISIIEKDFSNFPGGIAYSEKNSKYGFFNNPLRLSSSDFKDWVKNQKNQIKLIDYFQFNKDLKLEKWLKKNKLKTKKKFKNLKEIYLPRAAYSIFLKEKFINILNRLKKKKFIKVIYYENELIKVKKKNKQYFCYIRGNLKNKTFIEKNFTFIKNSKNKKKLNYLTSDSLILGHGILPPSNINKNKSFNNKNYIHDFYASGGTEFLMTKLTKTININKKKIMIVFIGNKAGLLETMQEFENLNQDVLKKINIISISSSSLTLEKAQLSNRFKSYKFVFLTDKNIKRITKARKILTLIKSEFLNGKKRGFNKYDVWTLILQKKILDNCYSSLDLKEKKIYNDEIFSRLRNITRYTYPETVDAKIRLESTKVLKNIKDKVIQLKKSSQKKILVKTLNSGQLLADIVVNVSGPVSLFNDKNEVPYLNSLKKICKNYNERGFISDQFNKIDEELYLPGTLSSNFNPERKTIVKSIVDNCKLTANNLIRNLI